MQAGRIPGGQARCRKGYLLSDGPRQRKTSSKRFGLLAVGYKGRPSSILSALPFLTQSRQHKNQLKSSWRFPLGRAILLRAEPCPGFAYEKPNFRMISGWLSDGSRLFIRTKRSADNPSHLLPYSLSPLSTPSPRKQLRASYVLLSFLENENG